MTVLNGDRDQRNALVHSQMRAGPPGPPEGAAVIKNVSPWMSNDSRMPANRSMALCFNFAGKRTSARSVDQCVPPHRNDFDFPPVATIVFRMS
jgi:hypothetical protein